jgi:hypothetical protein
MSTDYSQAQPHTQPHALGPDSSDRTQPPAVQSTVLSRHSTLIRLPRSSPISRLQREGTDPASRGAKGGQPWGRSTGGGGA